MKLVVIIFLLSMFSGKVSAQEHQDSLLVYDVDKQAQFDGGVAGWNRFVQEHLDIGGAASAMDSTAYVDYGLKQVAIMEFTVCEDGLVCDVEIVNKDKISPEFAKEALRVIEKSPKWTPAMKDGKPVRTRFKQSVVAVL